MLSTRMPDLSALEVLVTVAHTGSLNTAAAELGRTQQAVSARITAIEAQTGITMVTRTPRGSTLTAAGVVVAEWAARLLEVAAELDAGIAALRHDRQVRLRVAASLTISERLLPGWLVRLKGGPGQPGGAGTEVTLTAVNSDEVTLRVRAGQDDIGFVEGPRAPRGCRSRIIGYDRLVVVVPPRHPWVARRTALRAEELAATALVTREPGSGTRAALQVALARALDGQIPSAAPALELATTAAVRAAVIAGAGPAVLSALVIGDDLAAGRLRAVPVEGLDLTRALRAIWLGSRTPPAGPVRDLVTIATERTPRGGMSTR